MKKRRILALLFIAAVLLILLLCLRTHDLRQKEANIRTWQAAYPALAELPDFDWLSDQEDGSFLLHKYGEPDQSAVLPEEIADMLHDRELLGLRKSGNDVYFITSGALDDEWGYVITGDEAVCMEGLRTLERVGGSVYRFSTRK